MLSEAWTAERSNGEFTRRDDRVLADALNRIAREDERPEWDAKGLGCLTRLGRPGLASEFTRRVERTLARWVDEARLERARTFAQRMARRGEHHG